MKSRASVFKGLAGLFLLMEVVVLVVVSLLLLHYAQVQEDTERTAREETAAQVVKQFDEQIKAVYGLTESYTNDSRLSRIAYHMYPDEYERSKIILNLLDSINSSCEMNPFISDIQIMFPAEKIALSYSNKYDNQTEYRALAKEMLTDSLVFEDGQLKVQIPHPLISGVLEQTPDYDCRISCSNSFFESALTVFGDSENQGAMLVVLNREGSIFFSAGAGDNEIDQFILNQIQDDGISSLNEQVYLNGHRYALAHDSSQSYPITLITWRNVDTLSTNISFTLTSLVVVILLTVGMFIFFILQSNRRVARPIYKLMDAFEQVGKGKLDTRIHHSKKDEFDFIYDSFNSMTGRTEQLIENIKEQHNLLQNAELMQLQAQIDPHFLYNSFNIIKYMADGEEYKQITEFVSALAQYYRFINKETRQSIPLSAEVQHMETYLYIQQMRFEERIHVEVRGLTDEADNILVPKLILQPLVENCYNHGLKNTLSDGIIIITFSTKGRELFVSVEDNGREMNTEKLEKLKKEIQGTDDQAISHALANIRRRLELAYGEPDLLSLSIGEMGGLCVTLRFGLDKAPSNLL